MPTTPPPSPTVRPLRADARRNREAILDAALAQFGADGLDAQIDDIAARAGVGVGTVYRHFPTKEVLIEALAVSHFEALAEHAALALDDVEAGGDTWEAIADLLWWCARRLAGDVGLSEVIANRPETAHECGAVKTGLTATTAQLIARAVADGTVRADATVDDVRLVMAGLGNVVGAPAQAMGLSWERYLELTLDGLRAR